MAYFQKKHLDPVTGLSYLLEVNVKERIEKAVICYPFLRGENDNSKTH